MLCLEEGVLQKSILQKSQEYLSPRGLQNCILFPSEKGLIHEWLYGNATKLSRTTIFQKAYGSMLPCVIFDTCRWHLKNIT